MDYENLISYLYWTVESETSYLSNDGSAIKEAEHVRDLGVTLSNDATFNQHITERCELVKSKISWILPQNIPI